MIRARLGWLGDRWVEDVFVAWDEGGRVTEVRPGRSDDGPAEDGLVLPGLVNAHVHLEQTGRKAPAETGLAGWIGALLRGPAAPLDAVELGIAQVVASGTAVVGDVGNGGDAWTAIAAAGLGGVAWHEGLGRGRGTVDAAVAAVAPADDRVNGGLCRRPTPHSLYSTAFPLASALARPGQAPAALHFLEDPAERRFLSGGDGPLAELLDALGVDWRPRMEGLGEPLDVLRGLGLLGSHVVLVHGVELLPEEWREVSESGASVVLCPRSNLAIGGRLPDVPSALAAGARLALGTDGTVSSPDLDLWGDVALLLGRWPHVDPAVWMTAATLGGAYALRLDATYGALRVGARPGVLWAEGVRAPADIGRVPARSWRVAPRGIA